MTFTYDDPLSSPISAIRFLVGDTDSTESFLTDEEIAFLISLWGPLSGGKPYLIASYAAEAIAAKLAREVSYSSDSQSLSLSELMQKFLSLAEQMRYSHKELMTAGGGIYIGGLNPGEGRDPSVASPAFGTQMQDIPGAGPQDYGDMGGWTDWGQWGEYVP